MVPSSSSGGSVVAGDVEKNNVPITSSSNISASAANNANKHSSSLSSLGDASGVAILLGNHAKFGLAERCCYHFDLIETLTSLPTGRMQQQARMIRRRDRGLSISSQDGGSVNISESSNAGSSGGGGGAAVVVQGNKEGKDATKKASASSNNAKASSSTDAVKSHCFCGVVSLLECVTGGGVQPDRTMKRAQRSKHREFNTRAQVAWGRSTRGTSSGALKRQNKLGSAAIGGGGTPIRRCHQPRHLPLPLNQNTRVSFAYEITSIAIVVDASPSLTSTFGEQSMMCDFVEFGEEKINTPPMNDTCCVPLDRLGTLIKTYLLGLVQPIEVPPVAVSGLGVAFGRWKPNLAITVVAAYPPTSKGDPASAGLLVRDFRVTDESSALELSLQIERWALREVEGMIAERLCGERDFSGDGVAGRDSENEQYIPTMSPLGPFSFPSTQKIGSWTRVKSYMKDMLAVGDAALATLPPEGRPLLLVATDCRNVHSGGVFESLSETARSDVPINVLDLSSSPMQRPPGAGEHGSSQRSSLEEEFIDSEFSISPLSTSNDSQALRETCHLSGGIFLHSTLLDSYVGTMVGSPITPRGRGMVDYHFSFRKRTIKPNALQWYTLFTLSPFTPGGALSSLSPMSMIGSNSTLYRSNSILSGSSVSIAKQILGKSVEMSNPRAPPPLNDNKTKALGVAGFDVAQPQERVVFTKYTIQPIRIKSLLMTRVMEGYRARRYGHNTVDNDKVSVHFVLRIADCGVVLHYEASFVSSPYHMPMVGQAHIKLELSGDDPDFIQTVKKMFVLNHVSDSSMMLHGRRVSASSKAAAEKICKLLRWTRKEDYLESYLCIPGWGEVDHFAAGSVFLGRILSLTKLQQYRHFRSERFEVVTIGPNYYEKSASIFSDVMEQNKGEDEMYLALSSWSTGIITDRKLYFKEIVPPQDDDLAYYCVIRVVQSPTLSRLFTLTVDFHGELNAEQRLAVLLSLKEKLRGCCSDIIVLEKCISSYVAARPVSPSPWSPGWNEFFIHHKRWVLLKDDEVLPLLTKRRNKIGNFFVLHSDSQRAIFGKFVVGSKEERPSSPCMDVVIYQVLSRADAIVVDIHMEASKSFYPFRAKHSSTAFSSIYEMVKRRDKDCAKNVRSRTNLLAALDHGKGGPDSAIFDPNGAKQAEDVMRLIRLSTRTITKLRFFNSEGSGSANDRLCHLTTECITSDSFQTQAARLSIDQKMPILRYSGSWFIMRVDWYVLSVVCLELGDHVICEEGSLQSFRHISFFTAGSIDLYQSDEDVGDDAKSLAENPDAGSDHFVVLSEIEDVIGAAHSKNFAIALYEALRDKSVPMTSLENSEVAYALSSCSFCQIQWQTLVSVDDLSAHLSSNAQTMTGAKLGAVIGSLLSLVPGSHDQVFFYHGAENFSKSGADSLNDSLGDLMAGVAGDMGMQPLEEEEASIHNPESDVPLFFRFTLDKELVNMNEILALKKSATLAAQVSVFQGTEKKLPLSHRTVVSKLQNALNSFTSEQTLEKYRFVGRSPTEEILEEVMLNLPKTKHKSCEMPLSFFISRSNSLIAADNPTGSKNDLDHGFSVLMEELDRASFTTRASHESFLVLDDSASRDLLPYWCFARIQKPSGSILLQLYHPLGNDAAEKQVKIARSLVQRICDRTNQLLLLDSLCKTKNACNLLIPEEEEPTEQHLREANMAAATYSCPIQHKTAIPLHRRYSPKQAILALETTILQNFIISNRRGIFVYKDEQENVFYMSLTWNKVPDVGETAQNPHMIELLVYGCDRPGPSITDHLVCLLQRKLLILTLDALSSLLKKNPWFNLLASDLAFIKDFSQASKELDHDNSDASPLRERTYVLPSNVQDPLILLLMFRQNICGSTFIQLLHHESSSETTPDMIHVDDEDHGEIKLRFTRLPDFQFYFNSSPSQLDPNYQPVTTLTDKGREYSRQAGSGIAIIEVNLLRGDSPECSITVGKRGNVINKKLRVTQSDISLSCADNPNEHNEQYKISVEITNTTVDTEVIHKWVKLSLSQVLAAWSIERHLESSRLGLLQDEQKECTQFESNPKLKALNQTLPGFQALEDMVSFACDLPHPAISKVESKSMLRATVLANVALEFLLLFEGVADTARLPRLPRRFEGFDIVRSDTEGASLVKISKDNTSKNSARVELLGSRKVLRDKATDNPEYIVVFGLHGESQKSNIDAPHNLFFKQVSFGISNQQETSSFSHALSRIKNAKPSLFQRHLVFILRVSRVTRTLITYNANPQVRLKLELRFKEIEQAAAKVDERFRSGLQSRCLRHISFLPNDAFKQQIDASLIDTAPTKPIEKKPAKEEAVAKRGPVRRIPRPTSMLRPKLIGKSVDGSAMQAVAASRLRARSRPTASPSVTGKNKVIAAPPKDKTLLAERRVSGTQKKKRESVAKDTTSTVRASTRASVPRASLLKAYRDFLSLLKEGSEHFISQHRLNQSMLQHLAHAFFVSSKEKGSALISTRLICTCYSNFIGAGSIQQLQCDNEMSFATMFIDQLAKRWGATKIVPMNGTTEGLSCNLPHLVYLQKDLIQCSSTSRRAVILLEASMIWDNFRNSFVFSYNAWLINSTDKAKSEKLSRKPFASLGSIERDAAIIEAVALNFIGQLNLEQEIFHFACLRATRMARGVRRDGGPAALSLLKSAITRHCVESQSQLPSAGYRLQRRFLSPSSFLKGPLLDSCKKATLVEHLFSNCQTYNLTCIGSSSYDTCFVGKMKVAGFLVYYFIAWHESVESALDVFVLSVTKGQCIDAYITKEGSPFAEKILDVVLYSAMTTVQEMTENAAKSIRKLHLWRIFGEDYSSPMALGVTLMDSIAELRTYSFHLDLVLVDSHLETLMCDELNELQISWTDVFNTITLSASFSHCITFDDDSGISNHLVYYKEKDVFLDFVLDKKNRVQEARILARDEFLYDESSNTMESVAARCAVHNFTMFLLQWMWIDCETGF